MTAYSPHTCPLWLFRSGKDTFEISAILKTSQAEVELQIHILRSAEKNVQPRFGGAAKRAA